MPNEPLYQFYETLPGETGDDAAVIDDEGPGVKGQNFLGGNITQQRSCLSRLSSGQLTEL